MLWFISGRSVLFHWSTFLFFCQYHTILMTVAIYFQTVKSKVRKVDFPSSLFLSQDYSGYSGSFEFHTHCEIFCSPSVENTIGY